MFFEFKNMKLMLHVVWTFLLKWLEVSLSFFPFAECGAIGSRR